jgi:hypothetical protein
MVTSESGGFFHHQNGREMSRSSFTPSPNQGENKFIAKHMKNIFVLLFVVVAKNCFAVIFSFLFNSKIYLFREEMRMHLDIATFPPSTSVSS